jgi:hypothetical protein
MNKALFVLFLGLLQVSVALAQSGSGSAVVGSGSGSGSAAASVAAPVTTEILTERPVVAAPSAAQLRATCTAAMNADPKFAQDLLRVLDEKRVVELAKAQEKFASIQIEAGARVAKNQRHVIMAYAVMWIAAALFVLFLWRRQKSLREQIDGLRSDLASALKDAK